MRDLYDECRQWHQNQATSTASRFFILSMLWALAGPCLSQDAAQIEKTTYHFVALKGAGEAVCDAFLKRLNSTSYTKPPYCDIPENDSVPGFARLKRVPLTADEAVQLWSHVFWFSKIQNESAQSDNWPSSTARTLLGIDIFAWKYSPPVSLNNDGHPDNVLIWQGPGATSVFLGGGCGDQVTVLNELSIYRAPQYGYILTQDNKRIDENQTRELFGVPNSAPPPAPYAPMGFNEGVFEYRGKVYLEVFDDDSDLEAEENDASKFTSTLRIFYRHKNKEQQICEYGMTENPVGLPR